jgi:hypothetical protein
MTNFGIAPKLFICTPERQITPVVVLENTFRASGSRR